MHQQSTAQPKFQQQQIQAATTQLPTISCNLPQQQYMHSNANSAQQTANNTPYSYRMSSTSDEDTDEQDTKNSWQRVTYANRSRHTKKRKINTTGNQNISLTNKYSQLADESVQPANDSHTENKIPKPPPIYIYGVINYQEMINNLREIVEDEQYTSKTLANNTIKINCNTPDTYRKLVRLLREENIIHHTYQLKEERAFRVVIKHLHHTTDLEEIKKELIEKGHKVRNILNIRQKATKQPLNIFFVDLEPAKNNKEIYKLQAIQNKIIQIEPPKNYKGIAQCTRCQQYGHTKTYCNKPYVCVKCGGPHSTMSCTKSNLTPAKCALCDGPHPANYKGCEYYQRIIHNQNKASNSNNNVNNRQQPYNAKNRQQSSKPIIQDSSYNTPSYAQVTKSKSTNSDDITDKFTYFLNEFKNMFSQLLHQNGMILNMLTTVINMSSGK